MDKILILVEGQTEYTFVKEVLYPYFVSCGLYCIPTLAKTKRVKSGPDFKGGIVSYSKVKNDLKCLLNDTSAVVITTMIDYYGFSTLVPYRNAIKGNTCFDKVQVLESLFKQDISNEKFLPYLQLHEFEGLTFVSPEEIVNALSDVKKVEAITKIKKQFQSPEEINDNPNTTPSKRLEFVFRGYQKPLHSPIIAKRIGLDNLRKECKHFNQWINKLELLAKN